MNNYFLERKNKAKKEERGRKGLRVKVYSRKITKSLIEKVSIISKKKVTQELLLDLERDKDTNSLTLY